MLAHATCGVVNHAILTLNCSTAEQTMRHLNNLAAGFPEDFGCISASGPDRAVS